MPTTQADVGDWIANYSDEPEKVREFCVRHGILDLLRTAVELAHKDFPPIEKLTLSLWTDPLEGTEKVRIFLDVRSGLDEAVDGYWRFLGELAQAAPLSKTDLIGFSYRTI